MIFFHYETEFQLDNESIYSDWLINIINNHKATLNQLDYIFCDDAYLIKINQQFLNHDTYTDIITFDYCKGSLISGDVFISIERIIENAKQLNIDFHTELLRVMSHGLLHLLGFKDKSDSDILEMRKQENLSIQSF